MSSPCHNRPTLLLSVVIPEGGHRWRCAICSYERVGETATFRAPEHWGPPADEVAANPPSEWAKSRTAEVLPEHSWHLRDLAVPIATAIDAARELGRREGLEVAAAVCDARAGNAFQGREAAKCAAAIREVMS